MKGPLWKTSHGAGARARSAWAFNNRADELSRWKLGLFKARSGGKMFRLETYTPSRSFFFLWEQPVPNIWGFFSTIIWSNEPRHDIWSIPCQSTVVGRPLVPPQPPPSNHRLHKSDGMRLPACSKRFFFPSQVFFSTNWRAQVGTRTAQNALEHFWRDNRG